MSGELLVDQASVRYRGRGRDALHRVSFAASAPVTFVVGQNGAGKTTLFRAILGAIPLTEGSVRGGEAGEIGYCPQEFTLPARVRLGKYLGYIAWLKGIDRARVGDEVMRVMEHVDLTDRRDQRLGALSGGMRRRVGIAHALLGSPRLVLLDEPMAGVDPIVRRDLRELLSKLSQSSRLLISTHLVEDLALMDADTSVVVLHDGELMYAGAREAIPAPPGTNHDTDPRLAQEAAILALMGGRPHVDA